MTFVNSRLKQHPTIAFFVLAYAFCWVFWIPRAVLSHMPEIPGWLLIALQMLGVFGPAAAAVLLTARAAGREGLARLFAPYRKWNVGAGWYAFVIAFRPLIWLGALGIYMALGLKQVDAKPVDWIFFATYLVTQLPLVGVGEELGWMGFAYQPLRRRFGFLTGSLVLGLLWALWHLPMFFTVGDSQYGTSLVLFAVKLTAFRLMMSLAFDRTGSMLMPALFHVSMNALSELVPLAPGDPLASAITVLASLGIVIFYGARRETAFSARQQENPLGSG